MKTILYVDSSLEASQQRMTKVLKELIHSPDALEKIRVRRTTREITAYGIRYKFSYSDNYADYAGLRFSRVIISDTVKNAQELRTRLAPLCREP